MECSVEGCSKVASRKAMCNNCYRMMRKYGDPLFRANRPMGAGTPHISGYWMFEIGNRSVLRHVLIAETAIGKRLPPKAEVHHVDCNKGNDTNANLVVCQDRRYHLLLHKRTAAMQACGHADWIKCQICKQYSPAEEIKSYSNGVKWHPACWTSKFGKKGKSNGRRIYVQATA